jgi:hypothetical protein
MYKFINSMNKNTNHNFNKKMKMPTANYNDNHLIESKTVSLFSQPYLDTYNQCYKNIVVVNLPPKGPLADLVVRVNFPPLSEFKQPGPCTPIKQCGLALVSLDGQYNKMCNGLMDVNEVPNLISFLVSNGYTVDTSITKMFNDSEISFNANTGNKLICFVTYNS